MNLIKMSENDTGLNLNNCKVSEKGYFTLASDGDVSDICISAKDFKGVAIAARALTKDIKLVTGKQPILKKEISKGQVVIVGTIGHNEWIDSLVKRGKLKIDGIKGKIKVLDVDTNEVERTGEVTLWDYERQEDGLTRFLNLEMTEEDGMFRIFTGEMIEEIFYKVYLDE